MSITKEQARKELARRELARRQMTVQQAAAGGAVPGVALSPEDLQTIQSGGQISPQRTLDPNIQYQPFKEPEIGTQAQSFGAGVKHGATVMGAGLGKAAAAVTGDDQLRSNIEHTMNIEAAKNRVRGEEFPLTNLAGQITGEVATTPMLGPVGKTAPLRLLSAPVSAGIAGGLSASGRNEDALTGALIGAGFGTGMQALTEGGRAVANKLINANGGIFSSDDVSELVRLGDEFSVPVFVDDVTGPNAAKVGVVAENVPLVGTLKGREFQNVAQKAAGQRLRDKLAGSVDDFATEIQGEMKAHLKKAKRVASKLYNRAAGGMDAAGQIDRSNFKQAIQDAIADEQALGSMGDPKILAKLQSYLASPDGDFSMIRRQRTKIGHDISDFYTGKDSVLGSDSVPKFQAIKEALEKDIESFANKNLKGNDLTRFRLANKFYQNNIIDFKETQLKNLIDTNEPEKLLTFLTGVKSEFGRGSRAKTFFKNITPRGRRVIRAAIVDKAFQKGELSKGFSPAKFSSELEKLQNVTGVIFQGAEKRELDGITKLFRATQRAGQIAENPPTGARIVSPLTALGIGGFSNTLPETMAAMGGFGLASKALLQTNTGRGLLLGLNATTHNTAGFNRAVDRINKYLQRSLITASQANGG